VSERLVPLGKIVTTHGIEGWLKLNLYNPQTTILSTTQKVFLEKDGNRLSHILQMRKPHKGHLLLKLQGIDSIDEAKRWVSSILSVAEEVLQPLKRGEYYYYQVIGLDVFDIQGEWLGTVTRIWSKEGGDLYVVKGKSKEYLIPAVKEVIEKIDIPGGKVIINPPAGLLDL